MIFIFLSTFFGSLSPILYVKSHLNFDQEKILLARPVWVEVTAQMSDKFCKKPLMVDKPSPMGLLESLQPVGMGSKTIFFQLHDKIKSKKDPKFKSYFTY